MTLTLDAANSTALMASTQSPREGNDANNRIVENQNRFLLPVSSSYLNAGMLSHGDNKFTTVI